MHCNEPVCVHVQRDRTCAASQSLKNGTEEEETLPDVVGEGLYTYLYTYAV